MHEAAETRYAKSCEYHIAYQIVGTGPIDLVFIPGFISNVEHAWEYPPLAHFIRGHCARSPRVVTVTNVKGWRSRYRDPKTGRVCRTLFQLTEAETR